MVYGSNALVVKPAISLSPMLVVWILNQAGYDQLSKAGLQGGQLEHLHSVMFTVICMFPLIIGIIQLVAWSFYSIRSRKSLDMTLLVGKENAKTM